MDFPHRSAQPEGMRIVHYSIQGNQLHLILEAEDRESLARGMQGLAIRVAKAINRLFARAGRVWADRYHSHVLKTRREAANAPGPARPWNWRQVFVVKRAVLDLDRDLHVWCERACRHVL